MSGFAKRFLDALRGRAKAAPPPAAPAVAHAAPADQRPHEEPPVAAPAPVQPPRSEESTAAAKLFVASIRHLPLFSGTATQLMRSVSDEDVSGRELSRLISTDAALVAHLLRIVNSPFYGFANRVATVPDTLTVMGVNAVRRLVTASILQRPLMSYLHDSGVVRAFWRHELACAALSRHIARQENLDGETAYMAGLMHDVGRLAMLIQYPQHTDLLLPSKSDDDGAGLEEELHLFGFDHAQAGGALLELWGLPETIVEAALLHGDAVEPRHPLAASVWLANQLAHEMVEQPDEDDSEQPWMQRIALDPPQRRRILDEIRALEGG